MEPSDGSATEWKRRLSIRSLLMFSSTAGVAKRSLFTIARATCGSRNASLLASVLIISFAWRNPPEMLHSCNLILQEGIHDQ